MLKEIPKSDITRRSFKAYKEWNYTDSDVEFHLVENTSGSSFDVETSTTSSNGYYNLPQWRSLDSQYYRDQIYGNPALNFGDRRSWSSIERTIEDLMYSLILPQSVYGEEIKRGSIRLTDNVTSKTFIDDTYGNIRNEFPEYTLDLLDLEEELIVFTAQQIGLQVTASISSVDFENSTLTLTYNNDTDTYTTVELDFETNRLVVTEEFDFNGFIIPSDTIGNVFYDHGLLAIKGETYQDKNTDISSSLLLTNFNLDFNSTKTIYETEIFLPVLETEFNVSQNPTALEYKYDATNAVSESHIKQTFVSSFDGTTTGTWDDYEVSASLDQTGSYLTPYITTIGLYDDNLNMVAVAKLTQPTKSLPDYPVNFIVRLDT